MSAIAAALAGGAVAGVVALRGGRGATCEDEAGAIASVWNPTVSQRLLVRLRAAKPAAKANELHHYIDRWYSRYAEQWSDARMQACQHPDAAAAARWKACLDQRSAALGKQLAELTDAQLFSLPWWWTNATEPVETCKLALTDLTSTTFDDVTKTRLGLMQVQKTWLQGQHQVAMQQLDDMVATAERIDYTPLRVEMMIERAKYFDTMFESKQSEGTLRQALALAETSGDDASKTAVQTRLGIGFADRGALDEATRALEQAAATLERYGPDMILESNLETARGRLAVKSKQLEDAAKHFERAIALLELAGAVMNDPEMQLAPVYQQLGRQADADAVLAKIAKQMPKRTDPVATQLQRRRRAQRDLQAPGRHLPCPGRRLARIASPLAHP